MRRKSPVTDPEPGAGEREHGAQAGAALAAKFGVGSDVHWRSAVRIGLLAGVVIVVLAGQCPAGMPSFTLADVPRVRTLGDLARMRLEVISFFTAVLLLLGWVVQRLWNGLRCEFVRLPRISYGRALGVIGLWGLLFLLVLTMISGARELMTPGAWEKVGATYRLAPEPTAVELEFAERYGAIERLRDALWHGRAHGAFPPRTAIDGSLLVVPGHKNERYVYFEDKSNSDDDEPFDRNVAELLAVEPETVGEVRLAILRNGAIQWVSGRDVARLSRVEHP